MARYTLKIYDADRYSSSEQEFTKKPDLMASIQALKDSGYSVSSPRPVVRDKHYLRVEIKEKKSNSFFDDLFGTRTYPAKSKEWTSASHAKHGVPGFEKRG